MTNTLVVIINSVKYQKLRKFAMWNEISCTKSQLPPETLTSGLPPPDPCSRCPLSSTEFVELPNPHPPKKFLGTPLLEIATVNINMRWPMYIDHCLETLRIHHHCNHFKHNYKMLIFWARMSLLSYVDLILCYYGLYCYTSYYVLILM
jgi:hypothetical protein